MLRVEEGDTTHSFAFASPPPWGNGVGLSMTLETSVHAFRLQVLARAQALGNLSQACQEFGIS
ncbi:hypothetical protein [Candidatus Methylacidithermus pantelleriae]|uniref:Uncharacterized protein n=1 Tax=Candidatus Methylacidithermus pantelleriae TaxID=2744239 RepID=A0A8J2BNB2_9BACT|nr:hypothetical protein [Candidatus Methylacidithermus pantelleriae]CAF0704609.1 hypothetical protein MPNT_70091 [Candidatus Methylacidithermus pantelleriae]